MHLSPILGLFLAGHALLATGAAILPPPEKCRMVLIVHAGVIIDFDCQGGTTECDTMEDYSCSERLWTSGNGDEWYHCRCCNAEDECWGGTEDEGFCLAQIVIPSSGPTRMACTDVGYCDPQVYCPEDPTPVTGVATCPCGG